MGRREDSKFFTVEGVTKRFGALKAVADVSFEVHQGEIFGIAGPNGSGKSTLFNLITSIPFPADAGRIVLQGRDITHLPPHRICHLGLARTFQRETIYAGLSAFDNVLVAVENMGLRAGSKDHEHRTEEVLDFIGFPKTMHNAPAATLPLFYRKQLMLASAMALSPRLLLLDEPASSLTRPETAELKKIITRINRAGVTVLLIEHVLSLLNDISRRLMVLDHGKLLTLGRPDEVIRDPRVVEVYLGTKGGCT
ncbi:MAG: ABC transporter ATP-binding protein, partial [Thermodesulfobacteriota bacterium]